MNQNTVVMTIEEIYTNYRQTVFNQVLSVIKDYHASEEVTNNVFIKMFRLESAKFDKNNTASLTSWLHTITNHQILDYFRTSKEDRYKAVGDYTDDEGKEFFQFVAPQNDNADDEVLTAELQSKIAKAFRTLKPKYRKIAIMFFLRELEYNEIADILNIPLGSVKGTLSRARAMLQDALKDTYKLKSVNVQSVEA